MGFLKLLSLPKITIRFYSHRTTRMKFLNVAEKNDAAKNIAAHLSRGASNRREGFSVYNKIYEFEATVMGQQSQMVMTSVSGHLMNYEFSPAFRGWHSCNPTALFDAPLIKACTQASQAIKRTLEREIRTCNGLILWTDCDREGENIAFEIIKACLDIKVNLQIYRAKFSEITGASIFRALATLGQPDRNVSDAVDVRQELDLRTGAAFTRLQTLRLQKVFPNQLNEKLISYGSCQFPTLGFVVDRYKAIEDFIAEPFWRIKVNHQVGDDPPTEFLWQRDRLFDENACGAIFDVCQDNPTATVESVTSKPKSKWRPLPLDTVEMEKTVSIKLRINAKETMKIAEKLYSQGFISYPRTETNIFPKELNLVSLVSQQETSNRWGNFARRIAQEGGPTPRQGKKSDQAHPPIHPIKFTDTLTGNDARVYEYVVRHFLACVHKDAKGNETVVTCDIQGEKFVAKGLVILEKNYLDVYTYEKWNAKEINHYDQGQTFRPTVLEMTEGETSAPKLLTEADLIALMDKHGIGTDATHAEHIETIKQREYVGLHEDIYFVPGTLGMGLVEGYNSIGLEVSLAKPNLRAEFEHDLKLICEGRKDADTVRREQIAKYRDVFQTVAEKIRQIDESLATRLAVPAADVPHDDNPAGHPPNDKPVLKCPKCGSDMIIKHKKDGTGKFLSCTRWPDCKNSAWFPRAVDTVEVLDQSCATCGPSVKKLKIKFKPNIFLGEDNPNVLCIGGCDDYVLETLNINKGCVARSNGGAGAAPPPPLRPHNNYPTPPAIFNATNNNRTVPLPRPQYPPSNRDGDNDDIVCSCGTQALQLTVKKDGPNKGRLFYKCRASVCDFFLWVAGNPTPDTHSTNNTTISNNTRNTGNDVRCTCPNLAVQRTVAKDGPNKGRRFYCCSQTREQGGCGFFMWSDEAAAGASSYNGDDNNPGPGPSNWKRKKGPGKNQKAPYDSNQSGTKARAKRKCGKCGEEGHMRNKCPHQ